MTQARTSRAQRQALVVRAAAEAARNTPGVAFLRPGLGDLLRGTVTGRSPRGPANDTRTTGVRAERQDHPERWRLRVHLAVRSGHRALDVTRAVRAAVEAAVRAVLRDAEPPGAGGAPVTAGGGGPGPEVAVTVTVTVTDIT